MAIDINDPVIFGNFEDRVNKNMRKLDNVQPDGPQELVEEWYKERQENKPNPTEWNQVYSEGGGNNSRLKQEADGVKLIKPAKADGGGLRFDTGKNRLELIPPEWDWALGDILTKGAQKYADRNWERGMPWSKIIGPMKRHYNKFLAGERYDPETGCHHLGMVAWNALALMTYDIREIGENDLGQGNLEWLDKVNKNSLQIKKEETAKETVNEPTPTTTKTGN